MFQRCFESETYHGRGIRTTSKARASTIVLSAFSVLITIVVVAKIDDITIQIVIFVVHLLSTGSSGLIAAILTIYFIVRIKWKICGNIWRR